MIGAACHLHASKVFAVACAVAAEDDDALAGVIARSPKPIALMIADRFRKSVLLPEEIDRAGLAVTICENRRDRALLRRKFVVNSPDFAGHVFPAELIGEMLRQRAGRLVLGFQRREADCFLVSDVSLDRKDRRDGWRKQAG